MEKFLLSKDFLLLVITGKIFKLLKILSTPTFASQKDSHNVQWQKDEGSQGCQGIKGVSIKDLKVRQKIKNLD